MGAGAGGDTGAQPAITPDMLPPEDDSVVVMAQRNLALAEATLKALAEEGPQADSLRVHLARQWQEAAVKCYEAVTFYRAGRADEREAMRQPAPAPQLHRSHRKPRPNPGQLRLLGLSAAAGALRAAGKHALHHGPVAKLIAIPSAKAASITAASTAAVAVVGTVAVVTLAPSHAGTPAFGSAGVPAPAASIVGAVPIPSSAPVAFLATHPKGKHAGKGEPGLSGTGIQLPPCCVPVTQPSSSPASPQSSPSLAAGPAVLTVSTTAIDLSGGATSDVITLSATGGGWVSWKVVLPVDPLTQAEQADLDFSKTSGVLAAGQSVTVTVSLDPANALDQNTSETFTIGGVSVRVTLPAPASPAASAPSPAAS